MCKGLLSFMMCSSRSAMATALQSGEDRLAGDALSVSLILAAVAGTIFLFALQVNPCVHRFSRSEYATATSAQHSQQCRTHATLCACCAAQYEVEEVSSALGRVYISVLSSRRHMGRDS